MQSEIIVRGARQHNLKEITVRIPKNQLVVLTAPPARASRPWPSRSDKQAAAVAASHTGRYLRRLLQVG